MWLRIPHAPEKSVERAQILEEIILGKSTPRACRERDIGRHGVRPGGFLLSIRKIQDEPPLRQIVLGPFCLAYQSSL